MMMVYTLPDVIVRVTIVAAISALTTSTFPKKTYGGPVDVFLTRVNPIKNHHPIWAPHGDKERSHIR